MNCARAGPWPSRDARQCRRRCLVLGTQYSKRPIGSDKLRTAQNSFVFGTRCFEIINPTRNILFDSARPGIRFFGGLDRVVLSRIPAPSQLRAGPAREIEKFRVLASSAELRPSVYSWFGFQNMRKFLDPPPNLLGNRENL